MKSVVAKTSQPMSPQPRSYVKSLTARKTVSTFRDSSGDLLVKAESENKLRRRFLHQVSDTATPTLPDCFRNQLNYGTWWKSCEQRETRNSCSKVRRRDGCLCARFKNIRGWGMIGEELKSGDRVGDYANQQHQRDDVRSAARCVREDIVGERDLQSIFIVYLETNNWVL